MKSFLAALCLSAALAAAAPARAQSVQVPAAITVPEGDSFSWHTFAALGLPIVTPDAPAPYGVGYIVVSSTQYPPVGYELAGAVYPGEGGLPWMGFPVYGNTVPEPNKTVILLWFSPNNWPGFSAAGVSFSSQTTVITVVDDD